MGIRLRIGGFGMFVRQDDFYRTLTPKEKSLLDNFVATKNTLPPLDGSITVNIRTIRKHKPPAVQPISRKQMLLLRKNFPEHSPEHEIRFAPILRAFSEKILPHYLEDYHVGSDELLTLLKKGASSNRIIACLNGGVFCREKGSLYDIIYRHPSFQEPALLKWWAYNLNILQALMRMLLNSCGNGLLLHASSVEYTGYGYAFVGSGNSGKTTTANLAAAERILSNDLSLVRKIGSSYYLYPTPWWNLSSKNASITKPQVPAKLKALFFIQKAGKTRLERIGYKQALSKLLYFDWPFQQMGLVDNKAGLKRFYLSAQELAVRIPAFNLHVRKSPAFKKEFRRIIENELNHG